MVDIKGGEPGSRLRPPFFKDAVGPPLRVSLLVFVMSC